MEIGGDLYCNVKDFLKKYKLYKELMFNEKNT